MVLCYSPLHSTLGHLLGKEGKGGGDYNSRGLNIFIDVGSWTSKLCSWQEKGWHAFPQFSSWLNFFTHLNLVIHS